MKEWGTEDDEPREWRIYAEFWALLGAMILVLGFLLYPVVASGHSGGLAADGCHNDRKNGGRHCHRGADAGEVIQPQRASGGTVYFPNCTAARNAGAAPVRRGDPGYGTHLDRDGDGVGCE
jgi:hypothetical protein